MNNTVHDIVYLKYESEYVHGVVCANIRAIGKESIVGERYPISIAVDCDESEKNAIK